MAIDNLEYAITERIRRVFVKAFENETIQIGSQTSSEDVFGWDSLMHVTLIVGLEEEFSVRFTSREIVRLNTVGDMVHLLTEKCPHLG